MPHQPEHQQPEEISMSTTPGDPFELDIKATAELDVQGAPELPPGVIASFFAPAPPSAPQWQIEAGP
jgi:hypothetical protein